MIVRMEDPEVGELAVPGLIPKLSETPGELRWTGPRRPGSHNQEIYGELLGLTEAEMTGLAKEGVI